MKKKRLLFLLEGFCLAQTWIRRPRWLPSCCEFPYCFFRRSLLFFLVFFAVCFYTFGALHFDTKLGSPRYRWSIPALSLSGIPLSGYPTWVSRIRVQCMLNRLNSVACSSIQTTRTLPRTSVHPKHPNLVALSLAGGAVSNSPGTRAIRRSSHSRPSAPSCRYYEPFMTWHFGPEVQPHRISSLALHLALSHVSRCPPWL